MTARATDVLTEGAATAVEPELGAVVDCGGYVVPVDPMEALQCDSCQ